ncbi:cation transporter [Mycobacterium pseudokansasii]|nr:cation transporter [Mycobacterium pseudokansasii]
MASRRDARWHRAARWARGLAWASLVFVVADGAVGLWQGVAAGSVALTAWALGSVPEAMASLIVIWRFSGARALSETAELRAQRGVAVTFWLSAPYIAAESMHHLLNEHASHATLGGVLLTAAALVQMPILGRAQHKLGARLGSGATVGKGIQSYLCAAQAAAVLLGLALTLRWPGGWWLDPAIGLAIAGIVVWQGLRSWRGKDCGC